MNVAELCKGIENFEKNNWFGDAIYFDTLAELKPAREDLDHLTYDQLHEIVHMYLLQWGQMARVISQGTERFRWDEMLAELKKCRSSHQKLSSLNILTADLTDEKVSESITKLYGALDHSWLGKTKNREKKLGLKPTSISKTLHLLNPNLFVMWDSNIRNGPKSKESWSEYYLRFMKEEKDKLLSVLDNVEINETNEAGIVQILCNRMNLRPHILDLCKRKSLVKLLDEYEWWLANR